MAKTRKGVVIEGDPDAIAAPPTEVAHEQAGEAKVDSAVATQPWPQFIQHANISQIRTRYASELQAMANSHAGPLASYSILLILLRLYQRRRRSRPMFC
jgi:hypothetical protein